MNLTDDPGQTPLTQEELDELLIGTITTRGELDELEQQNIERAQEWLLRGNFVRERVLSEEFVFELHRRMLGGVWSWAGQQRRSNKNIGVEWTQIRTELKNLIADTICWIDQRTYSEDEIAVRFKHRLVSIRCFPNGNGRHSRLMADIIVEKVLGRAVFTWGMNDEAQRGEARRSYLAALRAADNGRFDALIAFARS